MISVNKRGGRAARLLLKGSLIVFLLWWLAKNQALSWEYFHIAPEGVPWIALGAMLILASILMTGMRYWLLLRANGILLPLPLVLRTELAATFFNLCSIGPVGGDIVRTYYIFKFGGNPMTVTGSTVVDRLVGLYALLVIACLAIVFCDTHGLDAPALQSVKLVVFWAVGSVLSLGLMGVIRCFFGVAATAGVGISAAIAGVLFATATPETEQTRMLWFIATAGIGVSTILVTALGGGRLGKTLGRLRAMGGMAAHGAALCEALFVFKNDAACIVKALCLSLVQQSSFVLAMLAFAQSLSLPVTPSFQDIVFATPVTFILAVFPLPGAGLGVNEAAFNYLLTASSPEVVGGASLYLFFRAWLLVVSMTGIPFYFSSMKKL
jgi:uncharacterized membrane protein YbhN (UPF0104 family)